MVRSLVLTGGLTVVSRPAVRMSLSNISVLLFPSSVLHPSSGLVFAPAEQHSPAAAQQLQMSSSRAARVALQTKQAGKKKKRERESNERRVG